MRVLKNTLILMFIFFLGSYSIAQETKKNAPVINTGPGIKLPPPIYNEPAINTAPPTKKYTFVPYPNDSLQRFIKNYSKDSLLHLIDNKITETKKAIAEVSVQSNYEIIVKDMNSINKHFKLGLVPLHSETDTIRSIFRMYEETDLGKDPSIIQRYLRSLDSAMSAKYDVKTFISDFLTKDIRSSIARGILSAFCDKYPIRNSVIDSLYTSSDNMEIKDKLQVYLTFAEVVKHCKEKFPLADGYKDKLYKELYEKINMEAILKENSKKENSGINESILYALQLMSYGLYGNNVSEDKIDKDKDLMYLLNLPEFVHKNAASLKDTQANFYISVYRLWALCEWKDKLKNRYIPVKQ